LAFSILQSALNQLDPQTALVPRLFWLMFWVATGAFAMVLGFLWSAYTRERARSKDPAAGDAEFEADATLARTVTIAVAVTVGILFVLLVVSIWTNRPMAALGNPSVVNVATPGRRWNGKADYGTGARSVWVEVAEAAAGVPLNVVRREQAVPEGSRVLTRGSRGSRRERLQSRV
jgi:heme/copper-type cytochrome/quinol oxidase subunit 2